MTAANAPMPQQLSERLDFIGLDKQSLAAVSALRPLIDKHLAGALDSFYAKLVQVPAVSRFFADAEQRDRAKRAQIGHWTGIVDGFGDGYMESATQVGLRHARIGLDPRWYIGGYGLILESMLKGIIADLAADWEAKRPPGFLGFVPRTDDHRHEQMESLGVSITALLKAVLIDVDVAMTTYFDKLTEDAAAEQKRSADKVAHAVQLTGEVLRDLAAGDLTTRITGEFDPDLQRIKDDTNAVADRLTAILTQLRQTSRSLKTATSEILSGANDLADRTTRQAASIEQTSSAMEQIASAVSENATRADDASTRIRSVVTVAEEGGTVMGAATGAMQRITESSRRISGVVGVIDDIAFQTNLLALNASVEAARAGEAGKGFSVVAVEVRRLAQSAAEASREIGALIAASTEEVRLGSSLVADSASKLGAIVEGIRQCSVLTQAIAEANKGQAAAIDEVNVAIRDMDEMTQHNAALVEEINATVEQTESQAAELDGIVDVFRLDDAFTQPATRPRRAAPAKARPKLVS